MLPQAEIPALSGVAGPVRRGWPVAPRANPVPPLAETFVGLPWLVRLRWGAVAGQVIALGTARFVLGVQLPWLVMGTIVGLTAASNLVLSRLPSAATAAERLIPIVLVVDALGLTAMLYVSGGPANPFSVFFLVHVALASLLLPPRAAWGLVGLTVVAFGSLFLGSVHDHHEHGHGSVARMHLLGMWVSYALTASFVAYFIGKVSQALRDRDRHLAAVEHLALQNDRLATLSSFSAHAAHELATPLATIGLAAKELASGVVQGRSGGALQADAQLICREVARCRKILGDISARAGESVGEMPAFTTPGEVLGLVDRAAARGRVPLVVRLDGAQASATTVVLPKDTLAQMITNLVRNAVEAHEEAKVDAPVELCVAVGDRLVFHVLDRGPGMSASVLQRVGQPFLTTKAQAGGLGLGVYLAQRFAQRLGGELRYSPRPGGGLDAELALPLDPLAGGS